MSDADTLPFLMQGSSATGKQPPPPNYLSARSANAILSEVRQTHMKPEALRSVNVLLDELLWLILGYARSFSTDRLRAGLLKALPTALGKDALLEAEVELRAYLEKNPTVIPLPADESAMAQFPLQPAFELLRLKCEVHSTLGDKEANAEEENLLHSRMSQIMGDLTPKLDAITPASLYLTAILEHICEHVLTNVGHVVARDSSRATAHSQDLYVALCEDETIYALFKTMKVQDQIEQQSKISHPRRSKSSSQNDIGVDMTHGSSPEVPVFSKARQSMDSAMSSGSNTLIPTRSSGEKGRSKVMFKSPPPTAAENKSILGVRHHRSNSLLRDKKASAIAHNDLLRTNTNDGLSPGDDEDSIHFDELMRSGTTMKVSLTPDRLKTFEVFAKEKNLRATRSGPQNQSRDTSIPPSAFSPQQSSQKLSPRARIQVESIAEAPEGDTGRSRAASISNSSTSKIEKFANSSRTRSFTETRSPSLNSDLNLSSSSKFPDAMPVLMGGPTGDVPKRTRRAPARNRESLDLDDIMDGIEDDKPALKKRPTLTPKSAHATASETRELLDFLSEGPPEPTTTLSSPTSSSFTSAKQSRFRGIKNFLTGSSSNEKLGQRSMEEPVGSIHKPVIVRTNEHYNPPRPSPPSLNTKRSTPNVSTTRSTPPDTGSARSRQLSMTRKAVPTWESTASFDPPFTKNSLPTAESNHVNKTLPLPSVPMDGKEPVSPISPTRKRVPPLDLSVNRHTTNGGDQKLSPTVSLRTGPHSINGQPTTPRDPVSPSGLSTPRDSLSPNGPSTPRDSASPNGRSTPRDSVAPTPQNASFRSESRNTQTEPSTVWPFRADDDHVGDLRRLIAKATNADECRVLVDMFLARCGTLPKHDDKVAENTIPSSYPTGASSLTPQIVEVAKEDEHELYLIEVLLGDEVVAMDPERIASSTTTNKITIVEAGDDHPSDAKSELVTTTPCPRDNNIPTECSPSSSICNSKLVIPVTQTVASTA